MNIFEKKETTNETSNHSNTNSGNNIINWNDHISININENKNEKENDEINCCDKLILCSNFCCIGLTGITLFAIIMGSIVWVIFAIKALINNTNSDIKDKCPKSDIWGILLTNVIVFGINLLSTMINNKKEEDEDDNYTKNIVMACIQLSILIWTGFELNTTCARNNLNDEEIYILLTYWFYFGCSMIGLITLSGCCFCLVSLLKNKKFLE